MKTLSCTFFWWFCLCLGKWGCTNFEILFPFSRKRASQGLTVFKYQCLFILANWILCRSKRKMINSSISKPMRGTQLTYTHLWFLDLTQTWIFFYFFCWSLIFLLCHQFYLAKHFSFANLIYLFPICYDIFFAFGDFFISEYFSLDFMLWNIFLCL